MACKEGWIELFTRTWGGMSEECDVSSEDEGYIVALIGSFVDKDKS